MKELSIEEKAKAYDIALDKIKRLLGTGSNCSREELEYIFPELKESEDERIRKAIINVFATHKDYEIFFGVSSKDIIAWLEKQPKVKPFEWDNKKKVSYPSCVVNNEDENIRKELIGFLRNIPNSHYTCEEMAAWLETQGEIILSEDELEALRIAAYEPYKNWSEKLQSLYMKLSHCKQGEQKPAWSEEDEERLQSCLNILQAKGIMGATDTINSKWLKSLKDRYTWKPSEEQMMCLDCAIKEYQSQGYPAKTLESLYEQLKVL